MATCFRNFICYSTLLIFSLIFFSCSKRKEESTADIFKSYMVDKGASYLVVPPGMVAIFLDDEQAGNKEIKDILDSVDKLSFLVLPNKSSVKESDHLFDLNQRLNRINFMDLAMINSGKEIIYVKVDRDSERVEELVILVSNYSALFCVSFKGYISIDKIVNLTKPENIAAISSLNRLSE